MFRFAIRLTALALAATIGVNTPAVAQQDKAALREAVCAELKNATEREICNDRHLTRDDAAMNDVYQILKTKLSKQEFKALRADQRDWLKERNRCSKDYQCIRDAYVDRLALIEQQLENLEYPNKSHVEIGCEGDHKMVEGNCVKVGNSNSTNAGSSTTTADTQYDLEASMVWQTHRISEPGNQGRFRRAVLSYGVPETDAVMFEASCDAGKTTTFATTLMSYQPASGRNGDPVKVNLVSGNYSITTTGEIYTGADTEEGVTGLLVRPTFNEAFWTVVASGAALTYSIEGGATVTLPLVSRGSSRSVRRFLKDCVALGATSKQTKALTCDDWGKVKSDRPGTPVTVKFTNKTEGHRAVMWINGEGTPIDKAALNTGETYTAATQAGHVWMFTDGPGNCIEIYSVQDGVASFKITKQSPVFGANND